MWFEDLKTFVIIKGALSLSKTLTFPFKTELKRSTGTLKDLKSSLHHQLTVGGLGLIQNKMHLFANRRSLFNKFYWTLVKKWPSSERCNRHEPGFVCIFSPKIELSCCETVFSPEFNYRRAVPNAMYVRPSLFLTHDTEERNFSAKTIKGLGTISLLHKKIFPTDSTASDRASSPN